MKIILLFVCFAIGGAMGARSKRASGGKIISIENAPYFVSLRRLGRHVCSGALITTQHVLTAAHCVLTETFAHLDNTRVVSERNVTEKMIGGQSIKKISPHPGFRQKKSWCNIAVITLSSHVEWTILRSRIALPNAELPYQQHATFTAIEFHSFERWRKLRELTVKINPFNAIPNNTDDYDPVFYGTLGRDQSITPRDLGGPLVYKRRIIGIAGALPETHRRGCYFINVLRFKTFIEDTVIENSQRPSVISSAPKRRRF